MKRPQSRFDYPLYTATWIIALPILVEICTGCTLFSLWIAWVLMAVVTILVVWRGTIAARQKCWSFVASLASQWLVGVGILVFFQLSFNNVIETPVSHPVSEDVVDVANPIQHADSVVQIGQSCPVAK